MAGRPGKSRAWNKLAIEEHLARGTYRPDRHGPKGDLQPSIPGVGPLGPPAPPQDPIAFINRLTHTKGAFARQPFRLRKWQLRILRKLFKKRPDGLRQYRTCLLMLPRKNGKTELAAAMALYGLLADGETGAEV